MEIVGQLSQTRIQDISGQTSKDIIGNIRINQKNYTDAFINNPDGGVDIYIEGIYSRNSALDGDLVKVQLNDITKWKLNYNLIATKWDDWSDQLLPIIEQIKVEELKKVAEQDLPMVEEVQDSDNINVINVVANSLSEYLETSNETLETNQASDNKIKSNSKVERKRRRFLGIKDDSKNKLPSNLPSEISKLQVQQIIHLPFSSECLRKTGTVVEIVKRNHIGLAGGYLKRYSNEHSLFTPTDPRMPRMLIDINECPLDFATAADRYKNVLFVAKLNNWNGGTSFANGSLVKIVGDSNNLESRMETLLMEHQIYDHEFPPDVDEELKYLEYLSSNWFEENSKGRRDYTKECVLTIDPKTARDLDDAVHIKKVAEQIYEVGVHIADVSYFVKELSAVDYYARLRTTSVYLVDRVIPMLPRILCERMCSLNPGEPKLTFSVVWKMDKYGHIIDQWIGRTIIRSSAKLAYEQAQDMIDNPDSVDWIEEGVNMPKLYSYDWKYVSKSVVLLNKIAQNLRAKRFEDGALKIEQVKMKFELDPKSGFPTGFTFEQRCEANFLIEEYMLLANMAVAKRIYQFSEQRAFLRRHPPSSLRLLKELKEFCDAKGCPLDITSSGGIQKSLNCITNPTMSKVVSLLLLRSMQPAEYICAGSLAKDDPSGFHHFALNVPLYTHFTSPIRRYPDIIVHRMLALALEYETISNEEVYSLALMADECTKRKISSKTISDTSQKWYFNLFVQKAGFCELLACVTKIYDQSFDIILIDYDRTGRVYLDRLKASLDSFKFESFHGIKRLVLFWKANSNAPLRQSKGSKRNKRKASKRNGSKQTSGTSENMTNDNNNKDQLNSRTSLETRKSFPSTDLESLINKARDDVQVIEVFDIVKLIVTVDEKDITQLKFDLKLPEQESLGKE